MEGPYRDLGNGFARLLGAEGLRRGPTRLRSVEDALYDLLRNSRDAGARNIYVASPLRARRYRQLVVIDDGRGIPETHKHLVFEPGVTTRHLDPGPPTPDANDPPHGAGLSLYHIKNNAVSAEVLSAAAPTSIKVVFDTRTLPERSLQSNSRPSKTNLPATLAKFAANPTPSQPRLYHASPARILATLLKNHIIHYSSEVTDSREKAGRVWKAASELGLEVSLRTVQRVIAGEVPVADAVSEATGTASGGSEMASARAARRVAGGAVPDGSAGPILHVGDADLAELRSVLQRAAGSSYLELEGLDIEAHPGEVILRARVHEPEEEYE